MLINGRTPKCFLRFIQGGFCKIGDNKKFVQKVTRHLSDLDFEGLHLTQVNGLKTLGRLWAKLTLEMGPHALHGLIGLQSKSVLDHLRRVIQFLFS